MNNKYPQWLCRLYLLATAVIGLSGCSILHEFQPAVAARDISPETFITLQRGDILTAGKLSAMTTQTIRVAGLDLDACAAPLASTCIPALAAASGITDERRLSALSELWLAQAISTQTSHTYTDPAIQFTHWMEAARHAYAYLFFTSRSPSERAFENRQTQVRDWYNYAVQQATTQLFKSHNGQRETTDQERHSVLRVGNWLLSPEIHARLPGQIALPQALLSATTLTFKGLRSTYRRDGFGAELIAVMDNDPVILTASPEYTADTVFRPGHKTPSRPPAWREMPTPNITVVFQFVGHTLNEILTTHEVILSVHDPLLESELKLHGQRVPLAGNFTAGYGLWLARSGFKKQSLRSLFGRDHGLDRPHLYLMQPFDPERRVLLMLHGLASSPEAWVNVANEILGDENLRREFQIWHIYYPTNMPVAINHEAIRRLLHETLRHFDPEKKSAASQGLILIGHSMGGMISRLMVSSSDQRLWEWALAEHDISPKRLARIRPRLDSLLSFEPVAEVDRVIFIATPHQGTLVAGQRLARWISGFIRLPLTLLENLDEQLQGQDDDTAPSGRAITVIPTSINNLDANDTFVQAAATLPISDSVRYHSIIARTQTTGTLEKSDDGLVPYLSAHLPGAASEKIIVSGHSVQETAASILEIRRILHEALAEPKKIHNSITAE